MSAETSGGSSFWNLVQQTLYQCRESRKLVLVIVAIGLLLDNMLLTAVGKRFDFVWGKFY